MFIFHAFRPLALKAFSQFHYNAFSFSVNQFLVIQYNYTWLEHFFCAYCISFPDVSPFCRSFHADFSYETVFHTLFSLFHMKTNRFAQCRTKKADCGFTSFPQSAFLSFFRFLQNESTIQRNYGICINLVCSSLTQYCHTLRFSWTRWIPEWSDEPVSPAFPELPLRWTHGSQY